VTSDASFVAINAIVVTCSHFTFSNNMLNDLIWFRFPVVIEFWILCFNTHFIHYLKTTGTQRLNNRYEAGFHLKNKRQQNTKQMWQFTSHNSNKHNVLSYIKSMISHFSSIFSSCYSSPVIHCAYSISICRCNKSLSLTRCGNCTRYSCDSE